jgi:polyhydroxybutyrate depolymerase
MPTAAMGRARSLWLTALLVLTSACAAAAQRADRAAGGGAGEQTLQHGRRERSYVVRAPRGTVRTGAPLPVVLVLHGGGGSAANAERMSGFTALVERERVLVVYPNGSSRLGPLRTWNAGHCCAYARDQQIDDVGFMAALLDTLAAQYPVDPARVYVTGMSNGAMMSHRLARELSDRIAAIAPVVGALFGDEPTPAGPVAMLAFNGARDALIPPDGGGTGRDVAGGFGGMQTRPYAEQGAYWARANGCTGAPVVTTSGALVRTRYSCPNGRAVELYLVQDNGHAWPGGQPGTRRGDRPSQAIDATAAMWTFFKANPKLR